MYKIVLCLVILLCLSGFNVHVRRAYIVLSAYYWAKREVPVHLCADENCKARGNAGEQLTASVSNWSLLYTLCSG